MLRFVLSVALASLLPACNSEQKQTAAAPAEVFATRGKVTHVTAKTLMIHHEKLAQIRNFDGKLVPMDSMTMPFGKTVDAASAIVEGDLVKLEFTVHYDSDPTLRITSIEKLPPETKLELSAGGPG